MLSDFIYFWLTKRIVAAESDFAILIVALADGVGCALACLVSAKVSNGQPLEAIPQYTSVFGLGSYGIVGKEVQRALRR